MKFSIVTPVYNGETYIKETIESVLSQKGDFDIEYIIKDGGSSDKTIQILKEYEEKINTKEFQISCNSVTFQYSSERDNGMYDAINKGFAIATGDIYAWINSDDVYKKGAFSAIQEVFKTSPDITWAKGLTAFLNKQNFTYRTSPCFIFNREWIRNGVYGRFAYFINQDSVFWRSHLWKEKGPISSSLRLAGDYDLWYKFAETETLWSIDTPVSMFRERDGQLSENMQKYHEEQLSIVQSNTLKNRVISLFFWVKNRLDKNNDSKLLHTVYKILFQNRQKQYIHITENGRPEKRMALSYIAK